MGGLRTSHQSGILRLWFCKTSRTNLSYIDIEDLYGAVELPLGYTAFNIYITPYVIDARYSSLPNVSAYSPSFVLTTLTSLSTQVHST